MSSAPAVPLTLTDLFTPAPSGVGASPSVTPAAGTWFAILLQIAQTLQLPVTSWQPGGVERTILAIAATAFAQEDGVISLMNQGLFLDYAASGVVTYQATNGETVTQPVTPDPSIPAQNPNGAQGWLDALAQYFYGVLRIPASYATGVLALVNTSNVSTATYQAGTYHVAHATTGATYSNKASLTVAPSLVAGSAGTIAGITSGATVTVSTSGAHGRSTGDVVYLAGFNGITLSSAFASILVTSSTTFQLVGVTATGAWSSGGFVYLCTLATMAADVLGPGSSAAPGLVTQTVTQNPGILVTNLQPWVGDNYESNLALADRARLALQARSDGGPAGAYEFYALTSSQILGAETPAVTLRGGAIIKAKVSASTFTGIVTTTIANASPASSTLGQPVVSGAANVPVTGATFATPIVVTLGAGVSLIAGDWITISDVVGNEGANGTFPVNPIDSTHVTLVGSVGTGAYVSGGAAECGDLGQVDEVIQQNAVPMTDTAVTVSATAFPVAIAATVIVPQAQVSAYQASAQTALTNYIQSKQMPIGGILLPGATTGIVDWSAIEGLLFAAGIVGTQPSYVVAVPTLTIDPGSGPVSTDVNFPSPAANAVLSSFALSVVGV